MTTPSDSTWRIELSAVGLRPTKALWFSQELGLRVLSVPGSAATASERCIVESTLGSGEIFIESLSWRRLALIAEAPPGLPAVCIAGQARAMRIFHNSKGTGIRTSWFRGWLTPVAAAKVAEGR